MLEFNPYFRPTASQLIESKVFDSIRVPKNEKLDPYSSLKSKVKIDHNDYRYDYELDKNLKAEHLKQIKEGFKINGKLIAVEEISYVENSSKKEIGLSIKNTGNTIIRTIFDHFKYDVKCSRLWEICGRRTFKTIQT